MIEVTEARAELDAPAKSLEELADRLYPLAGRTLKVSLPRVPRSNYDAGSKAFTVAGILDSVVLFDGAGAISVYIGAASGNTDQRRKVGLSSTVSVLTDGGWVLVHRPKED